MRRQGIQGELAVRLYPWWCEQMGNRLGCCLNRCYTGKGSRYFGRRVVRWTAQCINQRRQAAPEAFVTKVSLLRARAPPSSPRTSPQHTREPYLVKNPLLASLLDRLDLTNEVFDAVDQQRADHAKGLCVPNPAHAFHSLLLYATVPPG